jgi:tRNA dimethylallyltransferase
VAGGTGLYVRCLTLGLIASPPPDPALRSELERELAAGGVIALQERLRARDPARLASLADPENPRRLIRAIELAEQGIPAPDPSAAGPKPRLVGLRMTPPDLLRRIEARVHGMFERGLLEEVEGLRARYPAWSGTARHAIGYAEALTVLEGRCSVKNAMESTVIRTRQLARRQMTWFRHQADVTWVDIPFDAPLAETAARVQSLWNQHGRTDLAF